MNKRAMLIANSASMIDHFNKDNIKILKAMNYDITIAANFREGNSSTTERIQAFSQELAEQNIDIIDLPIPRKVTQLSKMLSSIHTLKKYLTEHPCEIVHTQTPFGGVVGRLAARQARRQGITKVIYFVHGFHFFKGASVLNYLIYYNIEKYLSRFTDCLITLNHEDFEAARNRFHHPNVKYVPGIGIDTEAISDMEVNAYVKRKSLRLPTDKPIILTVAELIHRKNVEGTIRAFADMADKNCILVICGKGILKDSLQQLTEDLCIADRVFFLGYRTDILDIYHLADIFLFTSYQEGLPVSVMQAMAAGLPIVASDIRGNRDLLGAKEGTLSSDYLIDVRDTAAFTKALGELLENPDKRRMLGDENAARCKDHFDISIVHKLMQEIYQETV